MIQLNKELRGKILDIGGGGEGIIGRLYRNQVIAIDNRQEELGEAPDGFGKLLMDATDLQFKDASFDHVTFFFTLMFMDTAEQKQALREAARVLKSGATVHIWDCAIQSAYPEPFCIDVDISLPEEEIHTTYGIGKLDGQSAASISAICKDVGLVPVIQEVDTDFFHFVFKKEEAQSKAAVLGKCGFYCGGCPTYVKGSCAGCVDAHEEGDCFTRDCVLRQKIPVCTMCKDFPCDTILKKERCTVLDKDWLRWKKSEQA